jgi:CxxC-x17-CxxC domain-containing protein
MKPYLKNKKSGKRENSRGGSSDRPERKSWSRPDSQRTGMFDGSGHERPEIFKTICAKCGKEAIVPFKPLGNKPILCKLCFVKKPAFEQGRGGFEQRGRSNSRFESNPRPAASPSSDMLETINRKLDKIMRALEID